MTLGDLDAPNPIYCEVLQCSRLRRPFLQEIYRGFRGMSKTASRKKFLKSYVVAINDQPVFSVEGLKEKIALYQNYDEPPETITLTLAPERQEPVFLSSKPSHLRISEIIADYPDSILHQLQTDGMTDQEKELKRLTRRSLKTLPNWNEWNDAFNQQLDEHAKAGVFGEPIERKDLPPEQQRQVCRLQWTNVVKPSGKRKCRACVDGSPRAAPWLRQDVSTYASCIEQPGMKLFFALAAREGMSVTFADTTNAFQQSPPPIKDCYVAVDEAYRDWYKARHGVTLDVNSHVLPLEKALQGHPEAGASFERLINGFLVRTLGFKSTTHERNLYRGTIRGHEVLMCRQIDDFAIASTHTTAAAALIKKIDSKVTTDNLGHGTRDQYGISMLYNGQDVHQTADYIKLSAVSYISRFLTTHGWDTDTKSIPHKTGHIKIRIVTVRRTFCDRFMWEETIFFA